WGPLSPSRPVDFTTCFQYGVLVSALNAVFVVAAVVKLRGTRRAALLPPEIVAGRAFWLKLTLVAAALVASCVELLLLLEQQLVFSVYAASLTAQTAAVAVALRLHFREQFTNRVGSTPLLLFWLATVLVTLMRLRTSVSMGLALSNAAVVMATAGYLLAALGALAMESQPKPHMLYELPCDDDDDDVGYEYRGSAGRFSSSCTFQSPEERANIFSQLTFSWMTPLLEQGYRKPLQLEDTWELGFEYRPDIVTEQFQRNWRDELRSGRPSLFRATMRTYGAAWALSGFFKLIKDLVSFLNPILLSRLIGFVSRWGSSDPEPVEFGYFYALAMFAVATVQVLAFQQHWVQNQRVNCLMKISYTTAIYRKTLHLSNDARQKYNIGGIVTHMSVDSQRVADFFANFSHHLWSSPLQIVLALTLLYRTLGWSMFAGVSVMVISIPTSARLSRSMRALNKLLMGYRDGRMKIMDEVLSGIKIIKLYAWESSFVRRINDVRVNLELATIKRYGFLQAGFSFVVTLIPFVVSFATFGLYSLADGVSHGPLTPQLVFVSLTLLNMLRFPLSHGPMVIPALLESIVSSNRIFDFLTAGEIDVNAVDHEPYDRDLPETSDDDVLVSVTGGAFKWLAADEHATISGIDIECKRRELVAVIGRVGAGKSSLASAVIGDMVRSAGSAVVRGSVAYVPQQPWIMNATLRDNILFGHRFDQAFYDRVIDACALRPDLEMLPAGDKTEIGEKGINLSGGQKARVSLARAVYSRADIYILDDPLAAVDAHVGKHIFTHVLGPQGMLKTRARILVTNAVQYLANTDSVVMLHDGRILEQGPFAQAMARRGEIFEFVHRFIDGGDSGSSGSLLEGSGSGSGSDAEYYEDEATQNEQDGTIEPLGVGIGRKSTRQTLGRASVGTMHGALARRKPQRENAPAGLAATMSTEVSRQGRVEWDIYLTYARACGSRNSLMFCLALLSASLSNVLANMWLKHWASSNTGLDSTTIMASLVRHGVFYYLSIYGALGLLGASMSSLQSLLLWTRCSIQASSKIHENMLVSVLRSPMSFFDVTPLGRILNRFSSDLQRCDESLPRSVSGMVNTVVSVLSAVSVIALSTPLMLVLMFPLAFVYRYLQQRYLYSSRELRRLDSTTRSPIFAHFQESIGGVSTIRAYNQQSRFVAENEDRLEQNIRAYYTYLSLNRWLALRLETLGNTVMLGTTLLAVLTLHYFGYGDAGLVGLSVTYALDFTSSLNWSVRSYTEVENSMIQLERVV
ncbi:hypothetical protein LPJ56_002546, partial [Coemansia sp. RSA 2599]